jgi:hypothetical protein
LATLVTTHILFFHSHQANSFALGFPFASSWLLPGLGRASCRIRTNDPEITNHVLWPTELKRRFSAAVIVKISNLLENGCKDTHYFSTAKTFRDFF